MQNARVRLALALAFLVSGGGFTAAQAHCPHIDATPTDTHHDGSAWGRPHGVPDHDCHVARTSPPPTPAATLAMARGSLRLPPPAPPALPGPQTTGQPGRSAPSAKLEQGALGKDAQPTTLAMALASLPMPLDPGWDLSTSVTTSGSVALGLAHLVEDESLSVSFGVGTDWSHTQGVAVLSLSL